MNTKRKKKLKEKETEYGYKKKQTYKIVGFRTLQPLDRSSIRRRGQALTISRGSLQRMLSKYQHLQAEFSKKIFLCDVAPMVVADFLDFK